MIQIFFALIALIWTITASAVPPQHDNTIERRTWSPIDGAPTSVWRMAQTTDGLLWFASPGGLYCFDGEKFKRVEAVYGHRLLSNNITSVTALRTGLAVHYQFGGLGVFRQEHAEHYEAKDGLPSGNLGGAVIAQDGSLYVGTSIGLAVLNNGKWTLPKNNGLPNARISDLSLDRDGVLWAMSGDELYALAPGARQFVLKLNLSPIRTLDLIAGRVHGYTSDGKIVRVEYDKKPMVIMKGVTLTKDSIFEGPGETLWAWLSNNRGLVHLRPNPQGNYQKGALVDHDKSERDFLVSSFVDREGNTWLGTQHGVQQLRAARAHNFASPDGVFTPFVHRGLGNSILVSGDTSPVIFQMRNGAYKEAYDIPNVQAMWRENGESLWLGNSTGVFQITSRGIKKIPLPVVLQPWQTVQAIAVDSNRKVWISVVGHGLFSFEKSQWVHFDTNDLGDYATPTIIHSTKSGRVILGFTHNRLGEIVEGQLRIIPTDRSVDIGNILSITEVGANIILGGDRGLVWVNQNGNKPLIPEKIHEFLGVSGLGIDKRGDLWLNSIGGIYHIAKEELEHFFKDTAHQLSWTAFTVSDGINGSPAQIRPLPSLTVSDDGKVYYANKGQLGWIDPMALRRNTRAPDVLIMHVRTAGKEMQAKQQMRLDAGITEIEFKYIVTALSMPEKVKIKYRLSGIDKNWQEPSGERVARYTNLPPGHYTFQVIAANEDGVWNIDGATLKFSIKPMFWQTNWFKLTLIVLFAVVLFWLHNWRVSVIAIRNAERAATRLDERERIARTLHDDLLQGVHALILRSGTILNMLPTDSKESVILNEIVKQAEGLVEKTRDQVMGLRANIPTEKLFERLCVELKIFHPEISDRVTMNISNDISNISSEVAFEIFQTLKEAIFNAVRHSSANKIIVSLVLINSTVIGEVKDDGIGIEHDILLHGAFSHWGIEGMRERIKRLGGNLSIQSSSEGTIVRFSLNLQNWRQS